MKELIQPNFASNLMIMELNLFEIPLLVRIKQLKVVQKRNFDEMESRDH